VGLDLTLLPKRHPSINDWILCHDRLSLDSDYDLFARLGHPRFEGEGRRVTPHPTPPEWTKIQVYGDDGIEVMTTDAYGNPLTFLYAREFFDTGAWPWMTESSDWNVAVREFVRALPRETPVILWWH
jgi:hypothetical protein